MKQHIVISIGRQFGAGGRAVGKLLAERLGIAYYDKELLSLAAREMGYAEHIFEQNDERHTLAQGFLQWLGNVLPSVQNDNLMSNDALFKAQSEVIRAVAERESCIIIGRCSDYVLRDNADCFSVFLSASMADRVARVSERMNITPQEAERIIRDEDEKRAEYYNFYSSNTWGEAATYDLCLDVSHFGIEGVVDIICDLIQR